MNDVLVISVKPEFAIKIIDGTKKIELRKSAPKANKGDLVFIYSTTPEKAIIGLGFVQNIIKDNPQNIWKRYSKLLGIDRIRYNKYYIDTELAVGIVLSDVRGLDQKLSLSQIKTVLPTFQPPQTFRYFDHSYFISNLNKLVNNNLIGVAG